MSFVAGTAVVPVVPNAAAFSTLLSKQIAPGLARLETGVQTAAQRISSKITPLGTTIGQSLTLGIGIAGIAAGKMAVDFEGAFTRISAISNASAADVEAWKGQVLDLAGATARAPQELADALFFLSSAGLEASQIMPALASSAKAAAVGLGSTVDVANTVASALNAYSESGLTATQATDALVAAVREGRTAPDELAVSLGRVLPIASQAGVSFEDLVASISVMTNIGLDSAEATTALRGALQAIIAPGTQAATAMSEVGLSAQELLDSIQSEGLFGALQLIDKAVRSNTEGQADYIGTFRKIIPNVRALTGVLGITGQEAQKTAALYDRLTDSQGSLSEAFEETQRGAQFTFQKLLTQGKVALTQFGEALLPVASALADVLGPALRFVGDNAGAVLTAFLAFKAATFLPKLLLSIASGLEAIGAATASSAVAGVLANLAPIAAGAVVPLGALAAALGTVYLAHKVLTGADPTFVPQLTEAVIAGIPKLKGFDEILAHAAATAGTATDALISMGESARRAWEQFQNSQFVEQTSDRTMDLGRAAAAATPLLEEMGTTVQAVTRDAAGALREMETDEGAWAAFTKETMTSAADAFRTWHDEAVESLTFVDDALSTFANDSNASIGSLSQGFSQAIRSTRDFGADIQKILRVGGKGADNFAESLLAMGPAGADAADRIAGASNEMIRSLVSDFNTGQNEADSLATRLQGKIVGALGDIRNLLKQLAKAWGITVNLKDKASGPADTIKTKLDDVAQKFTANVVVTGTKTAIESVGAVVTALTNVVGTYVASVLVNYPRKSPPAPEKIQMFQEQLDSLVGRDYVVKVLVSGIQRTLDREIGGLKTALDSLISDIETAVSDDLPRAELEAANDLAASIADHQRKFDHLLDAAERHFQKLRDAAKSFGDEIRGAFDGFDLVSGLAEVPAMLQVKIAAPLEKAIDGINHRILQLLATGTSQDNPAITSLQSQLEKLQARLNLINDTPITPTSGDFARFLTDQVALAGQLADDLKALSVAGLSKPLLAQFAQQGTAAIPTAEALIQSPELIGALNVASQQIAQFAGETSKQLVEDHFGKALDAASNRLGRLNERIGDFNDAIHKRIEDFLDALKTDAVDKKFEDLLTAIEKFERTLGSTSDQEIHTHVNLDGREIARNVDQRLRGRRERNGQLLSDRS